MVDRSTEPASDRFTLRVSEIRTLPELAELLRALRRRHARRRRGGELTYRELAAQTGSSVTAIAEYLTGRTLPPTDRFDALIGALGASPAEQGALATARDRVAEHHRRTPLGTNGKNTRRSVPRQLPADVFAFTGRMADLARLDALVTEPATGSNAVVISAVSGTAGVGKTALAVHWAHRMADRFPDGQLYVNLRGYDPERPMNPGDALNRLLTSAGVAGPDIPVDLDDRAARYRTELAGRRMLILLDNAGTVEQVRPLLPGSPTCVVVVTSRNSLSGLVARDGARRLDLDLLPPSDAVCLLGHLIGPRAEAEPDAVTRLADLCVRLPLALRLAAELAVSRPATSLSELAAELADRQERLALLAAGGDSRAAVTAVFSWSVRHLAPTTARTFRLLGLHPGPDLDRYAVAALTGTDPATARRDLDTLARAHLVEPTAPGRYGMHDLLRAYAADLAARHETPDDRLAAQRRLFDLYLATAAAAATVLHPGYARQLPRTPAPATPPPPLADAEAARTWLDDERLNLVAMAARTAANGWPAHTIGLSTILYRYLDGGRYVEALTIHSHAQRAAELIGDGAGRARALLDLGTTHLHLSRYPQAMGYLRRARIQYRRTGDDAGQARALSCLGIVERRRGRREIAAWYLRQAVALARRAGDDAELARAFVNLGSLEAQSSHHDAAIVHYGQALDLARRAKDRSLEAAALSNLGHAYQRGNHPEAAIEALRQSLAMFRQLGNRRAEADVLDGLGTVHLSLDRPRQAARYFAGALEIYRDIGSLDGQAWARNGLGEAARAAGQPAEAIAHHLDALAITSETGSPDQRARAHAGLGHAHHALGDVTRAREHFRDALAGYTRLRSPEADKIRVLLGVPVSA